MNIIVYIFLVMLVLISLLFWHIIKRNIWEKELHKAHAKLQKINLQLQSEVQQHEKTSREKQRIHTQLLHTQKLEAIGRLAGGIAHDFNNLLTVILGYSDLIMEETADDPSVYELAQEIKQVAQQATTLPRQLLAFSRKQVLHSEIVDVNSMLQKMRKFLSRMIREDIQLKIDFSLDDAFVEVDPGQIEQVIMNLVLNACDSIPNGGKLTITIDKVHINPRVSEFMVDAVFGDFVSIAVCDDGCGIEKEHLPYVFEPFFTTKLNENSGLGLSVVYGIVKQHNGWIHLESSTKRGTNITVFLPFCKTVYCHEEKDSETPKELYQGQGEKILLVEDDVQVCRFTSKILQRNGYKVFKAHSAEEAIDVFLEKNCTFDLVFSDVVLPKKNGVELTEYLMQKKHNLPVILTTGYADQKLQTRFIDKNHQKLLKKPYSVSDLLYVIRQTLD
ncbi:ATP-binding protein [Candidatus Uabimicrobium sp. HlEnr_7]|uniref:ATP-binding protein n=1 Tax=Candidatus Uabimicrobium helgolandensis TaxID=3095367 RepID=UPI003557E602